MPVTKRKSANLDAPIWFDGTNINEALFCDEFLSSRKIIFANGAFFTPDGRVTDDLPLRGEIYEELKCCAVNNIPRKVSNILEVMKLAAQVDDFAAVAAVSPSVWFPGWRAYADQHALRSRVVYLSLGDREEKSRNPVLASVGDAIRREDARLSERGVRHTLQWNVGNHFQDAEKRCADGFAWCMAQRKAEGKKTHEHETV